MNSPRVSIIIVTFGEQPYLIECVESLINSRGVSAEIIVVDNGHVGKEIEIIRGYQQVKIISLSRNLGFAGGCNLGVAASSGDFIVLINPDAVVQPDAISRLVVPLQSGVADVTTATLVLLKEPNLVNAAGNRIHPCGVSWCGSYRHPISEIRRDTYVLLGSGAALSCQRSWWTKLSGFQEEFFAYYEDTDFSLRTSLSGGSILLVKDAVVGHDYEFARNPSKMFLVDRNRMMLVLSLYRLRTLLLLMPLLLVHEMAISVVSLVSGWHRERWSAIRWIVTNRDQVTQVRSRIQEVRQVGDRKILEKMESSLFPENLGLPRVTKYLQKPLEWATRVLVRLICVTERFRTL